MIWFSASCTWTNLPNSVGLLTLPLRMISVCGSNTLTILPGKCVIPWKIRALVCFTTCRIRSAMSSNVSVTSAPLAATRCKMLHFLHHALGLIQILPRHAQKFGVWFPLSLLSLRPWLAGRQRNRHHSFLHCAHAVANLFAQPAGLHLDLLHRARQDPCTVAEQAAVSGIVNVRFHDGRIHPHPSSFHDPALSCQFHQPLVQIPDHFGTDHLSQPRQGLGIRHFLIADPREGPIDQIRAHFPLQRVVTPVPHMLQDQQPQRHFGGCLCPPARPALRMSLPLRFIHALHQSGILQQPICLPHPGFPQILDVFRQSRVPQTRSLVPQMDHSIASVTKFASDTHRHLLAQTQPPSHTKHTSLFTIFATESSYRVPPESPISLGGLPYESERNYS